MTMSKDAAFLNKQDFVTFMLYDDTESSAGLPSEYQPRHENGNLFSYPPSVQNTEGYNDKQKVLSEIQNLQFGSTGSTLDLMFGKVQTNETTESTKVETGYLSQALSLADGLLGTDLAKVPAGESGPTYTRKQSQSEQISVTLPTGGSAPLLQGYTVQYQAYTADNGAITCSFGVNGLNRYLNLFNSESLYNKYPDPSFVLPSKFTLEDSTKTLPDFKPNNNRQIAMEMRGVRFYATDFNKFTTGRLLANAKYRIDVPLYNASFQAANNIRVDLYWVKDRTAEALNNKHFIGTTTVKMDGWSDTTNNRTIAQFVFTPNPSEIPANKEGEHYQLYAVIDPQNSVTEVHENRSSTDPGGNNEGYFEFSVEDTNSVTSTNKLIQKIRSSAAAEDDIVMPAITFNGKAKWEDFYNEYIAGTTGPVEMEIVIVNKMPYTLPDTEIKITYIDSSDRDNLDIESAVYGKSFTLFPNETYRTALVIDGDFADKLREVGVDYTYGGYTMFWLDNLIAELSAEEEPLTSDDDKPEVLSADQSPEDDTDKYVQSVISQTWTLTNDTAVFWRTSVYEAVDTNENATTTTSSSGAVTEDSFTITSDPEDMEATKVVEVEITMSTIAGVTPKGKYAIVVEVSEDGEEWEEKAALEFDAESGSVKAGNRSSSNGGGCNSGGMSVIALGLIMMMVKGRKAR